jgi:hypothetical protein
MSWTINKLGMCTCMTGTDTVGNDYVKWTAVPFPSYIKN